MCAISIFFGYRQARGVTDLPPPRPALDGTLFVVLCAAVGIYAVSTMIGERPRTQLFPIIAGIALNTFAAGVLMRNWIGRERAAIENYGPALVAIGWIVGVLAAVWILGFVLGALVYMVVFFAVRGIARKGVGAALAIGVATIAFALESQLNVQLPQGVFDVTHILR